ncbi:ABC transporter related protein [Paenibacillus curdlanolyticus YK9]|uniref:ABC transporter related protein n=1 Tax=Paenibacillus curdlanolyticus YK9 TaxID=717606 RepID=E0I3Y5_9BACL|nr:ABC transporter ATP-binding protein [Paenibacillus curdlanolyticus]EFM12999.1 ABC transporter related protein [Paenibacillus curdlanolyticus YK9]
MSPKETGTLDRIAINPAPDQSASSASGQSSTVLRLAHVQKIYGSRNRAKTVIGDVSLTVREGEFVSVIGPSGSGKSTLFRLIGGLEKPTSGTIELEGQEAGDGKRGRIAYMPQQASLLPWKTVEANIELALTIAGVDRNEARSLVQQWLPRVGLADYAKAYPHVLSGGMQQRVSFLRALLSPQRLMCLDEPFGSLDALTRIQMQQWLLSLWEASRRSVLFVTHSIEEAVFLSDRIIVLSVSPSVVLREFEVPFPRPREASLRNTAAFNELESEIYALLDNGMS